METVAWKSSLPVSPTHHAIAWIWKPARDSGGTRSVPQLAASTTKTTSAVLPPPEFTSLDTQCVAATPLHWWPTWTGTRARKLLSVHAMAQWQSWTGLLARSGGETALAV